MNVSRLVVAAPIFEYSEMSKSIFQPTDRWSVLIFLVGLAWVGSRVHATFGRGRTLYSVKVCVVVMHVSHLAPRYLSSLCFDVLYQYSFVLVQAKMTRDDPSKLLLGLRESSFFSGQQYSPPLPLGVWASDATNYGLDNRLVLLTRTGARQ